MEFCGIYYKFSSKAHLAYIFGRFDNSMVYKAIQQGIYCVFSQLPFLVFSPVFDRIFRIRQTQLTLASFRFLGTEFLLPWRSESEWNVAMD